MLDRGNMAVTQQARPDLGTWDKMGQVFGDQGTVGVADRMTQFIIQVIYGSLIMHVLQAMRLLVQLLRRHAHVLQVGFPEPM